MEKRIALFFDIDGTLYDGATKSVLPSTIKMLEELKQHANYDLYLSTGRSRQTLGALTAFKSYFKGFNLSNGQEIFFGDQLIYESGIDKDDLEALLKLGEEKKYSLGLITNKEVEMNFFTEESYQNFTSYIKANVKNLNHQPFDANQKVMQIWMFATNEEIDQTAILFPNLTFLKWGEYGADVIPKGASKAKGIQLIQKMMQYEKENMYAFGDGDNDALMFTVVGTGVAMGNASQLAKEKAHIITDHISKDGLYKAVKKLNLIE